MTVGNGKVENMKLYVCSNSTNGIKNIDGIYYLITEEGECLASHLCSSKYYAKGDLYENRPEKQKRIRKIEEKKKRDEAQENISEKAIFSPAEERISTDKISEICKEEQIYMKESTVKKVINRIKGDRWGKWDDLITEMDGHSTSGIL